MPRWVIEGMAVPPPPNTCNAVLSLLCAHERAAPAPPAPLHRPVQRVHVPPAALPALQLARSLGVEQVAVVVTKLDTCDFDQARFDSIKWVLHWCLQPVSPCCLADGCDSPAMPPSYCCRHVQTRL